MAIRFSCNTCPQTLQVPDTAAGKQARCPSCQTINPVPHPPQPAAANAGGTQISPQATSPRPAPAGSPPGSLRIPCEACGKNLRVPASAAGKRVKCPSCGNVVAVTEQGGAPSSVTASPARPAAVTPQTAARPQTARPQTATRPQVARPQPPRRPQAAAPAGGNAGGSPWDDFDTAAAPSGGGPGGGFGSPYQPPRGVQGGAFPARPPAAGALPSGRSPALYIIPGVIITIWGALSVVGVVLNVVRLITTLANLPPNAEVNYPVVVGFTVGVILGAVLAVAQLAGGIAMCTRKNLSMARIGATVAAIPCFGLLAFPFGIWACVLVYSSDARRDFAS